jgi:hypothetical protein
MRSSLHPIALAVALGACSIACSDPAAPSATAAASLAPQAGESGASAHWNALARGLVVKYNSNAFQAIRGYAVLSLAQYNAVVAAETADPPGPRASVRAAVSRASAVALAYLYPTEAAALETQAAAVTNAAAWPGEDAAAGDAAGRAAAEQAVARARGDDFFAPWTGAVPTGAGMWFSTATPAAPPLGPLFGKAKPFLLRSGDQFRPPAPPAFGSAEFVAALAEVRRVADARTPQQDSLARFWALPAGTYTAPGYWNDEATRLTTRHQMRERDATHLLALMNMAGLDAIVASHDAKFAYWLLRPSQADPAIRLAVGLPNFPSYPSNHATLSAAMTVVLGDRFPAEKRRLDALADEAAMSRLYGGIHFRFDSDAGLRLGRQVGAWALQHDVVGHRPFALD